MLTASNDNIHTKVPSIIINQCLLGYGNVRQNFFFLLQKLLLEVRKSFPCFEKRQKHLPSLEIKKNFLFHFSKRKNCTQNTF